MSLNSCLSKKFLASPLIAIVSSAAANDDPVIIALSNKKLKMLAAMEPSEPASTSTDDYAHLISHEVTAYLSPLRVTDEKKLSPSVFWKNHADVYPNMAMLARLYLTPCASSVTVKGLFSVTGLINKKLTRRRDSERELFTMTSYTHYSPQ